MNQPIFGHSNYQIPFSFFVCEKKGNALEVLTQKQRNHHQPTEHFFFKQEPSFLISSFLTFEVLFGDILGLRLFAIVLNHHTTATNHFIGVFFSLSVLQRPTHSLSLLSSALIRLIWCSTQRASTNLTSQLDASTHGWAWRLSKALAALRISCARP